MRPIKLTFFCSIIAYTLLAQTYQSCGNTKDQALKLLTETISTKVSSNFSSSTILNQTDDKEQVQKKLSSYFKTESNLILKHIHYFKKNNKICAAIQSEEQKEYIKNLLAQVKTYNIKNLPQNIDKKVIKLQQWLNDINSLKQLIVVFQSPSNSTQKTLTFLANKEKTLQDLYDKTLTQASSLIFKACKEDKQKAKEALSTLIFQSKQEKKGFFESISTFFKTKEDTKEKLALNLFDNKIKYSNQNNQVCAFIKKEEISNVANRLYHDISLFNPKLLSKDPLNRYKEINNLLKKITLAQLLMQPFPKKFSNNDFQNLASIKEQLEKIKQTTYPQYITFNIINAENITLKINDKIQNNNTKVYLKPGDYTYEIKAKNRCPIKGNFHLNLFDKKSIDIDFDEYHYPTVLFLTDKEPHIAIEGTLIQPNIKTTIPKCQGEVFYIAKYANQTKKAPITLAPNKSYQFDLTFLTTQELSVFNNAKTKYFTLQANEKYSDSLTPVVSKSLEFFIEEKPNHGTLTLSKLGTFIYTPENNYIGKDSFTYYIEANGEKSPIKVVNLTIINNNPIQTPIQHIQKKQLPFDEAKYQRFKQYLQTLDPKKDGIKIKKLAQKYPQYFQKFLEELRK